MMTYLDCQVEDMEEELDQDTTSALDGIVGSYDFNKEQLQVFEELVRNMRGAAWGIAAALYMKGMTLARCFRVLDSVVLGILIYLGALAFKRVVKSENNQLAYCIQVNTPLAALASFNCAAAQTTALSNSDLLSALSGLMMSRVCHMYLRSVSCSCRGSYSWELSSCRWLQLLSHLLVRPCND